MAAGAKPSKSRAICKIYVAGRDITDRFEPYGLSIQIDVAEGSYPIAKITCSDSYGVIQYPESSDTIRITLGWIDEGGTYEFNGTVNDVESTGTKKEGRRLEITANGADLLQQAKEPQRMHLGEGDRPDGDGQKVSIGDALKKSAKNAGLSINIDPEIENLRRNYIAQHDESFSHFGARIAREVGGSFVINGTTATMSKSDSFVPTLTGGIIDCKVGPDGNVLAWRIKPQTARPSWQSVGHMHFDPNQAKYVRTMQDVTSALGFTAPTSKWLSAAIQGSQDHATQANGGASAAAEREKGTGWTVIRGNAAVAQNCGARLSGYRSGVDGGYLVKGFSHTYNKKEGWETRLDINNAGTTFPDVANPNVSPFKQLQ